ncbi:MAG: ETC complex I subunit [Alphaproteobacteria bacterium]|nr:ETC complex I subunit [Alphaproteobacteria bacterium]
MMVRIYQPTKTAMQSGRAKIKDWILEYRAESRRVPEPLMGWVSAGDTTNQVRIPFDSREEAVAFAKKHGFAYTVQETRNRRPTPKAYADNFAFARKQNWTH